MTIIDLVEELILAGLGTLGFSLIFKVPANRLFYAFIGGVICWGGYLWGLDLLGLGILGASLLSAVLASFYAEIIARLVSLPTPMIAIPAYIPLIPGKGLYYCMSYGVARQWEYSINYGIQTLQCALGMALGMALVFAFFAIGRRLSEDMGSLKVKKN